MYKLASCDSFVCNLCKGENTSTCENCLNWDVGRAKYSKKVIERTNGYVSKPHKLMMKTQKSESMEMHKKLVDGKLSRSMETQQLKTRLRL